MTPDIDVLFPALRVLVRTGEIAERRKELSISRAIRISEFSMRLSEEEIACLLQHQSITDDWPWSTHDERRINRHLKNVVDGINRELRVIDQTEYGHYGSGYASYVDSWFYREDDEFRFHEGDCYWGLVILFSRLSHYYVIGQGQKTWQEGSGSSYLPCYEFVDRIDQPPVLSLVDPACEILEQQGLVRVSSAELSPLLSNDFGVPTILSDPPWRHFDALFYWED